MRMKLMQRVLEHLNDSSVHIDASALISSDGLMICSALPSEIEEDRVGAMAAALSALSERAADELSRGNVSQILMQGTAGTFMTQAVGDDALLTVLITLEGKVGTIFTSVNKVTNALNTLLEQVYDDYH